MDNLNFIALLTPSIRLLGARLSLLDLVSHISPPFKPFVICSARGGLQQKLAEIGLEHCVIPHRPWRKGRFFLTRWLQVRQISRTLKNLQPALIHCNEFHILPQAIYATKMDRWKNIKSPVPPITVHVRLGITPRQIQTYHLRQASRIIAVSHAVADLFNDDSEIKSRVRVVYNGVDVSRFTPFGREERIRARKTLGLDDNAFVAGIVGLIGPRKRQHIAIEALRRLHNDLPALHLLLAGEAFESTESYGAELHEKVKAEGLGAHVHFLGYRDNIVDVYRAMNLNLLISSEEGFGRTIIESAAMEIPSVGSRIGGIPELILDGRTGRLVNLDAIDDLAVILRDASMHPDHFRQMGCEARRRVVQQFSIEAYARNMETVWREAMDEGR